MKKDYLFTSESVSEGHPDKVCDRISDMVVDTYLSREPQARVACETLTTTNKVVLAGETRGPEINKDELLDLIDAKCFMLKDKYYEILEKKKYNVTDTQRNKIEEFMKKYHEEERETTKELLKRTELILLNNNL